MNRDDFEKFVIQNYDASFDYPWKKSPKNEVHGIFKAYHMNKENCVTVGLDGIVSDEELKSLVRMSYYLASGK